MLEKPPPLASDGRSGLWTETRLRFKKPACGLREVVLPNVTSLPYGATHESSKPNRRRRYLVGRIDDLGCRSS